MICLFSIRASLLVMVINSLCLQVDKKIRCRYERG